MDVLEPFVRTLFGRKRKSINLRLAPQLLEAFLARSSWLGIPLELYLVSLLTADWLQARLENAECGIRSEPLNDDDGPPIIDLNPSLGELLAQVSYSSAPEVRLVRKEHATGDRTLRDMARRCDASLRDFINGALKVETTLDLMREISLEQYREVENRFKPRSRPRPPCHSSPRTGV